MTDIYMWRGHYADGTIIDEYDESGNARGFASVDVLRLVAFELVAIQPGLQSLHIVVTQECRPIFFRRRAITLDMDTGTQVHSAITVLGFQKTLEGRNFKSFMAVFPDGSIMLTDDPNSF